MANTILFLRIIISISFFTIAFAFDPSPLQDFCVADLTSPARSNGLPCKDPSTVQANDFFFSGLHIPGNTTNPYGAAVTPVNVIQVPGLNTLGLSLARLDLAPNGFIPPHHHHRATEILTVLEGSLEVGFITSNPNYKHFNKVLQKGDVFAVPIGLLHYQRGVGNANTVVIAAVNSQNPGIITVPNGVFGAKPGIDAEYLSRAFQLDRKVVEQLQANLKMATNVLLLSIIALSFCYIGFAFEPSPLQDFCVADPTSSARVNGQACKNPALVGANDFFFSGLHLPGNTSNPNGSRVTPVSVAQLPGLNTLGISLVRIDYAPSGINPLHTHPRATEILTVIEGSLEVGFITSNPDNKFITKTLWKGDVFVFPIGLIHFQRNVGTKNAVAIAALSSQNPGVIGIANAVFGSKPDISSDILAKAFQMDKSIVQQIQAKF
ncbi:hypothetical protein BUALT_Bualt12G0005700 [Buddleja alternifolia]|uniref:Cupin type-1 domain-containing protein n=1 Tax=Buddleja alternifolia TaxID=168488 RepID=A0AAV6WMY5_9LAMI|nr:hypothetical protein BUALT_Bualt12G0005700 [Buddleja alternifolia]